MPLYTSCSEIWAYLPTEYLAGLDYRDRSVRWYVLIIISDGLGELPRCWRHRSCGRKLEPEKSAA